MNYCNLRKIDSANGPGVRVSLYVSGCTNHCKGCFSPQTWDFQHGSSFTDATKLELLDALAEPYISGLSILGGDPLHPNNREKVAEIVSIVKRRFSTTRDIWMWTGYTYENLLNENDKFANEILSQTDVLVDGPFVEELKDLSLKFRGSSNQRIVDLRKSTLDNVVLWS